MKSNKKKLPKMKNWLHMMNKEPKMVKTINPPRKKMMNTFWTISPNSTKLKLLAITPLSLKTCNWKPTPSTLKQLCKKKISIRSFQNSHSTSSVKETPSHGQNSGSTCVTTMKTSWTSSMTTICWFPLKKPNNFTVNRTASKSNKRPLKMKKNPPKRNKRKLFKKSLKNK